MCFDLRVAWYGVKDIPGDESSIDEKVDPFYDKDEYIDDCQNKCHKPILSTQKK